MSEMPCGPLVMLTGCDEVVEEDADDLAEAERHDGEVVAAQLERRRAEQHAEEARDGRADRQDDPERQVQIEVRAREQRVHVRAYRVERDVAEVEQPGEADDDVEAERQEHVQDREVRDAYPRRSDRGEREGQHEQRDGDDRERDPHGTGIVSGVEEITHGDRDCNQRLAGTAADGCAPSARVASAMSRARRATARLWAAASAS